MTLLIVADDDPDVRALLADAFRSDFSEIAEASDGRQLFWRLVQATCSHPAQDVVVLSDICMPNYSGLDVLEAYDDLGYHPATVLITAFPDRNALASTVRAGGTLVAKPFLLSDLRKTVRGLRHKG